MSVIRLELARMHDGQARVKQGARRYNVLQCGRRWGKTSMGLLLAYEAALAGHFCGWFAPTYKLLSEEWNRAEKRLAPIIAHADKTVKQIRLTTGGVLDFWSMDNPDPGRGRKYHRVVIDEAGIVKNLEEIWTGAIRPTLTDFKGDAWFLGTPKGRNYFSRLYSHGQAHEIDWASWRVGTIENPTIPDLASELASAARDLPKHVFDQEYNAIPADDGGNPFGIKAIESCVGPLSNLQPDVFGVDLAKHTDWTVVIGLDRHGCVCVFERWQSDWRQTRERVLDMVGMRPTLIDSTGVGDPIVEDLQRHSINIEGFKFSATSKQQLMEGLATAIQRGELRFPDGVIAEELRQFEYQYRLNGGVKYSAPEGLHDDCVSALALARQKCFLKPIGITDVSGVMMADAGFGRELV